MALARWLSNLEGVIYRLPNQAEWEDTCRVSGTTRYAGSNKPIGLLGMAATFEWDTAE